MDEAMSQGWSVLAVGPANIVTEPDAVRGLVRPAHTEPWAGGAREMRVPVRPTSLMGRRITPADRWCRGPAKSGPVPADSSSPSPASPAMRVTPPCRARARSLARLADPPSWTGQRPGRPPAPR
ncbi:hypothetical protein EASAB2608_08227 [Streptomyces sp. EAS-AB2608]|nr:hypothetical protein EASAB2608_08227 [Streptomyces sp. EAS-AB2608]